MKSNPLIGITTLTLAGAVAILSACAVGPSNEPAQSREANEPAEVLTGSHLPRRDKRGTTVIQADKDAIESAIRGSTQQGKPP